MSFLFKLSRRWARLRTVVLAGTLVMAACEFRRALGSIDEVDRVVLSPSSVTIQPNQTVDFTAVGFTPAFDTAAMTVTWSVTGGSITDKGDVGGRHLGQYKNGACGAFRVTATSRPGNKADTADVSIPCPAVAAVTVSPAQASIDAGQTVQLAATPRDANGNELTGRVITWTSGNTATATVSGSGLVRGVAAGSATITATSEGRTGTSAITVVAPPPPAPVAAVTVSPAQASIDAGQTVQLTATPRDASGSALPGRLVTWTSGNTAAATVSGSGLVRGVAAGSATISATSEGQSGTAAITVTEPPPPPPTCPTSSSAWLNSAFTAQTGAFTVQFDATPNLASMDGVTGLSAGAADAHTDLAVIVRFNASGGIDARNGGAYTAANSIAYTPGTSYRVRLAIDIPTRTYAAYVTAPGGSEVTIGTGLAFRIEQNAVTGLANVALYADIGTHAVCGFSITSSTPPVSVASVPVTPASASVDVGAAVQLTATPRDASGNVLLGRLVTWTSGNTAAATVSGSGLVRGVAAGSATITATSEGQSGTSAITVVAPPPAPVASVAVSPAQASVEAGRTLQLTATPRDASGNALTGRAIAWTSGNTAAATVSGSGLVSGVAAGGATITATSEGQSGSAAVTVTAAPPPGSGVVFVGAGDIASCSGNEDEGTAKLLDGIPGTVFTAGDNVYPDGTAAQFAQCYEPTWGRHKARTRPSPGNHDYHTSGAAPYYAYFGANAGPAGRGYYSYDLGDWHLISLNSNISMSAGSTQEQWLRADLAANPKKCVLAYWHHPRFSAGSHGSSTAPQPLWQALYDFNADVVIAGHDHNYQRFAPQTPTGQADPVRGIRQFLAGMGGESHYSFSAPIANTEAYNTDTDGVLKLTLYAESYTWEFIPVAGKTYRDSGNGSCH